MAVQVGRRFLIYPVQTNFDSARAPLTHPTSRIGPIVRKSSRRQVSYSDPELHNLPRRLSCWSGPHESLIQPALDVDWEFHYKNAGQVVIVCSADTCVGLDRNRQKTTSLR